MSARKSYSYQHSPILPDTDGFHSSSHDQLQAPTFTPVSSNTRESTRRRSSATSSVSSISDPSSGNRTSSEEQYTAPPTPTIEVHPPQDSGPISYFRRFSWTNMSTRRHPTAAGEQDSPSGLLPALDVTSKSPSSSTAANDDANYVDLNDNEHPTEGYSGRNPTTPPHSPREKQGRTMKRAKVYRHGTPERKLSRNYRDRTPRAGSPGYGSNGLLTPEASPIRTNSPTGGSDDELPTNLHGNNPHARSMRQHLHGLLAWASSFHPNLDLTKILPPGSGGSPKFGGNGAARILTGEKGRYIDKDDKKRRGRVQPTNPNFKRNALVIGAVCLLAWFYFFGIPVGGPGSASTATSSKSVPRLREKLRGKAEKEQVRKVVATTEELDAHLMDGLPKDILSFPRHPIDRKDGTLVVNETLPAEAHPIYQLIKDSREKWNRKVKRQSKTLKQAVIEYRRRNKGMNPPRGFDRWWKFVVENDIPLPDEYDQINNDLRLFRALSPRELANRVEKATKYGDTFTFQVQSGSIRTRSNHAPIWGADDRVQGQVDLLTDFGIQEWLPDLRAVYSIHDTPSGLIEYSHRQDLLDRVEDDEYYTSDEELDTMLRGLHHACPPNSLTHKMGPVYQDPATFENKTFIADPMATFDLCNHPTYFPIHGVTAEKNPHMDGELKAMFSLSKTALHTDVLGVPVEQYVGHMDYLPWDKRKNDRLLWRGTNTGTFATKDNNWRITHRFRLIEHTKPGAKEMIDLLPVPHTGTRGSIAEASLNVKKGTVNAETLDITFANKPLQCSEEDGTCDILARDFYFNPRHMHFEEAAEYKYILDVDGNSWSARTRRLFAGGSLVFKSTIMPEWWTERAQAWVHYIPIKIDYTDLHDAFLFFRGDIYGRGGEDKLAKEIAEAGAEWAATSWRRVDMAAYVARLYLEWGRLLAPSRSGSDFVYHPSMEVTRE